MPRWVLALALSACGPIAYVNEVTRKADDALEAARQAEADKYAPYWWTRAKEYLHKARENAAHADFQGANKFGRLAAEAAEQAIADAKDPAKRPIESPGSAGARSGAKRRGESIDPKLPPNGVAPAKTEVAPAKDTP